MVRVFRDPGPFQADSRPDSPVRGQLTGRCGCRAGLLHSGAAFGIALPVAGERSSANGCGCSSVVEHDLAKVGVEGSNPFARSSSFHKWLILLESPEPFGRFLRFRAPIRSSFRLESSLVYDPPNVARFAALGAPAPATANRPWAHPRRRRRPVCARRNSSLRGARQPRSERQGDRRAVAASRRPRDQSPEASTRSAVGPRETGRSI